MRGSGASWPWSARRSSSRSSSRRRSRSWGVLAARPPGPRDRPVEERQRLVLRDEPRGAAGRHRLGRRADREAVLAIARLLAGLADQVLPLLADAVHHRERPRATRATNAGCRRSGRRRARTGWLIDGARCALGRLRQKPCRTLRFVAFDVALAGRREAIDLRLVETRSRTGAFAVQGAASSRRAG